MCDSSRSAPESLIQTYQQIRVCTFNVNLLPFRSGSRRRIASIAAFLNGERYHIVAIQEAFGSSYKERLAALCSSVYPYWCFSTRTRTKKTPLDSGLCILSRLPLTECEQSFFSYRDLCFPDTLSSKGVLWTTTEVAPGFSLAFGCTHTQAVYGNGRSRRRLSERRACRSNLDQCLEELKGVFSADACVLAGDLNCADHDQLPEHEVCTVCCSQPRVSFSETEISSGDSAPVPTYPATEQVLDYVLSLSRTVSIVKRRVRTDIDTLSDHLPLECVLNIER